jgi:DNA-binding transcriptional LysR family regulator
MNILPTEQVVEKTAGLNCDLGFISYPVEHKKLSVREVLEDKLVIITAPNHPLAHKKNLKPKDLEGQNFIMHEKGSAPRRAIEELIRKNNISIGIPLELSSNRAIKRAVEEGTGIALISRKVANEEIRAERLKAINVADPSMTRKFFLIHHKDKYISESLRLMMDMVFNWTSDYAKKLS